MVDKPEDGGPAADATLRDLFAIAALQGMWAGQFVFAKQEELKEVPTRATYDNISAWAYAQADAMIAARKPESEES